MKAEEKKRFHEARFLSRNPYAGIEVLERWIDDEAPAISDRSASLANLQNQYAFINDEEEELWAATYRNSAQNRENELIRVSPQLLEKLKAPGSYSDKEIEESVRRLHIILWNRCNDRSAIDPVALLDPSIALQSIGYEFSLDDGIGQDWQQGLHIEVAGIIDNEGKRVIVSRQLKTSTRFFTAAHELGHAILHGNMGVIHRDRPMDGPGLSREPIERDADKFATYFLMPRKLVSSRFREVFGTDRFVLGEATAFALARKPLHHVKRGLRVPRDLSLLLASTEQYNGVYFQSLSSQFHVSPTAMAIRLEELGLIGLT